MLNPELHSALVKEFKTVVVRRAGEKLEFRLVGEGPRKQMDIINAGEEYSVNCPYCGDTRRRLSISYRWGMPDPDLGLCLHLCNCYRSSRCMRVEGRPLELYKKLYGFKNADERRSQTTTLIQTEAVIEARPRGPIQLPGACYPLNEMAPNSAAVLYLKQRRYDPVALAESYGVSYCVECQEYPMVEGRIVIPFYQRGKLEGWQARFTGDKDNWDKCPKYYNCPGMPRRLLLYNVDTASRYRTVVICEGITDAWRVGPCGVAVCGSKLTRPQAELVVQHWRKGLTIVISDSDAAGSTGGDDNIKILEGRVDNLVRVTLADAKDPGAYDEAALWDVIEGQCMRAGYSLADFMEEETNAEGAIQTGQGSV